MSELASCLGIQLPNLKSCDSINTEEQEVRSETECSDIFRIPYDNAGLKCVDTLNVLNLCVDSKIRLTQGPHAGDEGVVKGKNREGHYIIIFQHALKKGSKFKVPFERILGKWWVDVALRGQIECFPVVNA